MRRERERRKEGGVMGSGMIGREGRLRGQPRKKRRERNVKQNTTKQSSLYSSSPHLAWSGSGLWKPHSDRDLS